jgi:hypothetical protein
MASAILSSDGRLLPLVGLGLLGASSEGSKRAASSCTQKKGQHAGIAILTHHTMPCFAAVTSLSENNQCTTVVVVHVAQTMGGLTVALLAHVHAMVDKRTSASWGSRRRAGLLSCLKNLRAVLDLPCRCCSGMTSGTAAGPSAGGRTKLQPVSGTPTSEVATTGGGTAPSSTLAAPYCTAAAANGCGGSCCGCVTCGRGFCTATGLACSSGPELLGPACGCHCSPKPKLLAALSTAEDGALLLSSQLKELLPARPADRA